jgi:hypothetical protein
MCEASWSAAALRRCGQTPSPDSVACGKRIEHSRFPNSHSALETPIRKIHNFSEFQISNLKSAICYLPSLGRNPGFILRKNTLDSHETHLQCSLNMYTENQTWVIERGGDVVEKKAQVGLAGLSDWARLVYCLWVTDYMMRNAGDFANAEALYPAFQTDATQFARSLGLATSCQTFSLSRQKLQREYFDRFEAVCEEIKRAEGGKTSATH